MKIRTNRKPDWLKVQFPTGKKYLELKNIVNKKKLHTICQSGHCPNIGECWTAGTATFLILGDICTRNCTFCNVTTGKPKAIDNNEPLRIAEAVKSMNIKHCVITSVTRDDINDKGASIWANTINEVKKLNPNTTLEVLIPDMKNDWQALKKIINESPEIVSHNMETVSNLYATVRPQADYKRSLAQIKKTKEYGAISKSGFMLGIGEKHDEVVSLLKDLAEVEVDILSIGQYLQPTHLHHEVIEYVHPTKFDEYKNIANQLGIKKVEASPLVRSSYHSEKQL